ncbi:DegT/DnrJ/EryC1/StrS family aminotransferase [uncultured Aquimarina sp.]|uniref:DegT/DnrJ/EryC1/StrS family aminotransferase n=1 Tax=uncultured Aquimarina sp. TaxID=575652 RepID=UPI00260B8A91|nr:DegT/DnrJ/EryC1/StrS family aminotransferase [uncultured Aquimarina sp.]
MTNAKLSIPFLDLPKINKRYHEKFKSVFANFLDTGIYIKGNYVEMFEKSFATSCGVDYCIGVGNGLDALTIILKAYIEIGKLQIGDEVIIAANTFIATILSVKYAGLTPVLVEPDEYTFNLDVNQLEKHITHKTKVIIPTHLYGQLANIEAIKRIAKQHNVLVIDDAAQAHGAQHNDTKVAGSLFHASAFSFYPAKNLGALGDAGAITTNDGDLAHITRCLGNYGSSEKYRNEYAGVNSRLDELQAAFLLEKLTYLEEDNTCRRSIAKRYLSEIKNEKIKLPFWDQSNNHVFHLFVVRVENRKDFCNYLEESGVGYHIHYPIPPHKQRALQEFSRLSLPITERIHNEVVSIPLNVSLETHEIDYIIQVLNQYQ